MYAALLQYPEHADYDTSALRLCVSGGAAMPVEVLRGFEEAFGCIILEGYGLSETSPVASFNHPDRERKPGSIGTPIEGVEFRLVDDDCADVPEGEVGEIAIKGHNVMKGYWNRPEATEEAIRDGWFRTGDMARRDEDGYYFIVDRKKDLIIRGGFNVYPREIEEVLYEHPAVAAAAVIGVPHPTHGEEVAAAVQLLARAPRPRPRSCATTSKTGWRRTSTPGMSGSSTPCRWGRPARSSNGTSSRRPSWLGVERWPTAASPRGTTLCGGNSAIAATSTTGPAPSRAARRAAGRRRARDATGGSSRAWPASSSASGWHAGRRVARRGWGLAAEFGRIVVGTSQVAAVAPGPTVRRPRLVGQPAASPAGAGLYRGQYDRRGARRRCAISTGRPRSGSTSSPRTSIEALAPSNSPVTNPQALKAGGGHRGHELPARRRQLRPRHGGATADPQHGRPARRTGWARTSPPRRAPWCCAPSCSSSSSTDRRPRPCCSTPLLVIPPMINKFYAIDLAPGRSMVEYLVQQGVQVFVVSWRNPDARHRDWGIDTYARAIVDALDGVQRVTGADRAVLYGACSGGIVSSHDRGPPGRHRRLRPVGRVDARRHGARPVAGRAGRRGRGPADGDAGGRRLGPEGLPGRPHAGRGVRLAASGRPDLELLGEQLPARQAAARVRHPVLERRRDPDAGSAAPRLPRPGGRQRADHPGRRSCSAARSTSARSRPTPTCSPASPTTSATGSPATAPRTCWAATPGSCCRPAGTSPPSSTRPATPRPSTRWPSRTRRTRPSSSRRRSGRRHLVDRLRRLAAGPVRAGDRRAQRARRRRVGAAGRRARHLRPRELGVDDGHRRHRPGPRHRLLPDRRAAHRLRAGLPARGPGSSSTTTSCRSSTTTGSARSSRSSWSTSWPSSTSSATGSRATAARR